MTHGHHMFTNAGQLLTITVSSFRKRICSGCQRFGELRYRGEALNTWLNKHDYFNTVTIYMWRIRRIKR
jgi:hypothetical protein